jgi:hypothetical protein
MKEVAEHLRILRTAWKNSSRVSETVTKSHIANAEGIKLDRLLGSDIRD